MTILQISFRRVSLANKHVTCGCAFWIPYLWVPIVQALKDIYKIPKPFERHNGQNYLRASEVPHIF